MSSPLFIFPSQLCNYDWIPRQFLGRGGNMRLVIMAELEVRRKTVYGPDLSGAVQLNILPRLCNLTTSQLLHQGVEPVHFALLTPIHPIVWGCTFFLINKTSLAVCCLLPLHPNQNYFRHSEVRVKSWPHRTCLLSYVVPNMSLAKCRTPRMAVTFLIKA